ncbi:mCG147709 [Mus musculus]|nr:mCG147709 [Mus musculus]
MLQHRKDSLCMMCLLPTMTDDSHGSHHQRVHVCCLTLHLIIPTSTKKGKYISPVLDVESKCTGHRPCICLQCTWDFYDIC